MPSCIHWMSVDHPLAIFIFHAPDAFPLFFSELRCPLLGGVCKFSAWGSWALSDNPNRGNHALSSCNQSTLSTCIARCKNLYPLSGEMIELYKKKKKKKKVVNATWKSCHVFCVRPVTKAVTLWHNKSLTAQTPDWISGHFSRAFLLGFLQKWGKNPSSVCRGWETLNQKNLKFQMKIPDV